MKMLYFDSIYVCAIFSFPIWIFEQIGRQLSSEDYTDTSYYKYTVIFNKRWWGVIYYNSQVCKTPIVKVDRNKSLTLIRCPLGSCK